MRRGRGSQGLLGLALVLLLAGCGEYLAVMGLGSAGPPADLPVYR